MVHKKPALYIIAFVGAVAIITLVLAIALRPATAHAAEYMRLSKDDRTKYAQERYTEFSQNANKNFEIMISFNNASYRDIASLLSGEDNIISAFHYFEANGECAIGSYTDCKGKDAERVLDDYYSSIYNLVVGQIENQTDYIEELEKSNEIEPSFIVDDIVNDSTDTFEKELDTSPIIIDDSSDAPDVSLEDELRYAKFSLGQFILQKEAMDNGYFNIYGIRLVMTGAEIERLLYNDTVSLVEILDFDNNNLITPVR